MLQIDSLRSDPSVLFPCADLVFSMRRSSTTTADERTLVTTTDDAQKALRPKTQAQRTADNAQLALQKSLATVISPDKSIVIVDQMVLLLCLHEPTYQGANIISYLTAHLICLTYVRRPQQTFCSKIWFIAPKR